jgi:hypothetical protein
VVVAAKFTKEAKEREAVATKLGVIWNYVYNELTVTTEQVICGEGEDQTTLTPILKVTEENIGINAEGIAANKKILKKHGGQIAEKAGIHVEELVDAHGKKIKELIEVTGAGGGGARMADLEARIAESTRGVMNIGSIVDDLKEQMLEKCDKSRVDEKIEGKYEEIIDHLQAALSSAGDDEDEFKRVSMELQEICQQLSSSKADKRDLLELKEQVLFDSRVREQVEQLKEFLEEKMDTAEASQKLDQKPDRTEMQKLLADLKKTIGAQMKKVVAAADDGDAGGGGGGGGGGEGMLSATSMGGTSSSAGYGDKKHMYANLVWKKGKMPPPKPIVNANPEACKMSYGGGYTMKINQDSQGPPMRQGHSADVLPKLQRPPPPNPRTG